MYEVHVTEISTDEVKRALEECMLDKPYIMTWLPYKLILAVIRVSAQAPFSTLAFPSYYLPSTRTKIERKNLNKTMAATATSPTTQTSPAQIPPSVFTLPHTAQLEALYTIIRDKNTSRGDFLFYSDRIIRLLVEEGLNHLPVISKTVETPTVSCDLHHSALRPF